MAFSAVASFAEDFRTLPPTKTDRIKVTDRVWSKTPGDASVCIWKDDKLAAVSFTIDDNWVSDHAWWDEMGKKYGFRATWFIITANADKTGQSAWDSFQKLKDEGHDLQSHTVSHLNKNYTKGLDGDYGDAIKDIESKIKGAKVICLAYPGGNGREKNNPDIAMKYYYAARGTAGHNNPVGKINYRETNSLSGTIGMEKTFVNRRTGKEGPHWAYVGDTIVPGKPSFRNWVSVHYHGVNTPQKREKAEKEFQFLKEHEKDYWLGLWADVIKYGQERDTAELKVVKNTASEISFTLTDKMVNDIYDYPLTIKICVPSAWGTATAVQNGKPVECRMVEHDGAKYVFVQAVPDRGEVTVSGK